MFGMDGSEIMLIIVVSIMLFGSKNIPTVARNLAKGIAQLKNATNDIKSEIQKSAEESGIDVKSMTGGIQEEIEGLKGNLKKMTENSGINQELENIEDNFRKMNDNIHTDPVKITDVTADINSEIDKVAQHVDDTLSGPIKRQS